VFTGLIQDVGVIRRVERQGPLFGLTIQTALPVEELQRGESIAVAGICLTVVGVQPGLIHVEVSPETLERTTLGRAAAGWRVNLERALRLSDRLGGHLVTGHVDGMGWIHRRQMGPRHLELEIRVPTPVGRYVVEKGSVAVDGISLTVNRCGGDWFGLTLIPHTIQETTLAEKGVGDPVNIECDIVGKYVEKLIQGRLPEKEIQPHGVTEDYLREHGFMP
jgi:riboflavin synthase